MGKVGILTSSKRWINEEITVTANGEAFGIGIVEYTDDWSPFKPCPFDRTVQSEDEEEDGDSEDSDGISDTWNQCNEEELEDGEFKPVANDHIVTEEVNMCDGDDEAHNQPVNPDELNRPQVTGMNGTTGKENPCPVAGEEQMVVGDDEPSPSRTDIINVNNNWNPESKNAPVDMQANPGQKETNMGSEVNLVSLGCFGPFPSTAHQGMTIDGPNKKGPNDRRSKRRRADSGGRSCSPIPNTGHPTETRIGPIPIDLNSNPRSNSSASEDSVIQETQEVEEDELEATVKVGVELGFQIDKDDLLIICDGDMGGDKTVNQ
ncbi:hypothetical protein L1887_18445 [Cichorium endivia]|nr:hypothetical protein L1887_18445 [Cichorium endivia]